jgi:hypothetical protein
MHLVGWAVLDESYVWDEDLNDRSAFIFSDIIESIPEAYTNEVIQFQSMNGVPVLLLAMSHNHYGPRADDFINIFHTIAAAAPGSYGRLHLYDEEGIFAPYDAMTVYVLMRGTVHKYQDPFFNPFIPNVEGPDPDDSSPTPVSERVEKYLPLGTVVTLNGGDKELMIFGRLQKDSANDTVFDYVGCPYPEGNIAPKATFLFNHADIAWIHYWGYANEAETAWNEKLRTLTTTK